MVIKISQGAFWKEDNYMHFSFIVPTILIIGGLFFISAGVGLRSLNYLAPILGFLIGVSLFLLAGKVADLSKGNHKND